MNITKHTKQNGSTVYRTSLYLGIDQVTGKKVKTTITARTKKEVKAKATQALADFKTNGCTRYQAPSVETFADLVEIWWGTYCHTVKVNSQIKIRNVLDHHILPAFGMYKLDKLTPVIFQNQVNQWAKEYNQDRAGYKEYPRLLSYTKRILQYGVSIQALPSNPAREVITPRRVHRDKEEIKHFSDDELRKFLDYLDSLDNSFKNYFDTVLYKLLLATGLRIGEALALEWSDIDLQGATLEVSKTINLQNTTNTPKTQTSSRILDLDKKTVLMLRLYQARQAQIGREIGVKYSKVFSTTFDKHTRPYTLNRRLKNHLKNAGCQPLTFHAFRHTHASILLNAGLDYKEIQDRLGHSDISMTINTYSHLSKENKKRAVSVFENALENIKSS